MKRYQAQFLELFDTLTQVVAYTDDKEEFSQYVQQIYDELNEYHMLFDIYSNYDGINNIKTINDNAGVKPIKVDDRIISLLEFSITAYKETDGLLNVAYGSVLEIWHDYRESGTDNPESAKLPPAELLSEAAGHTDIENVIIDIEASTVFLKDPFMKLDVGAVAKGYAVEMVAQKIIDSGFSSGLLSVGGNVRAIGRKSGNNDLWNLGIQNPDKSSNEANLHILYLEDSSLVTSGNYIRYYTVEGKQYHHIIDPDTNFPADLYAAVSVVCSDSGYADVLSTALYMMDYDSGLKLIKSFPDTYAMWVMPDGSELYSPGFLELSVDR